MAHIYPLNKLLNSPQHLCIYRLLESWAVRTPEAVAIVASGRTPLTYGRLHRHMEHVIQTLHAMGLGCNDRIALMLPDGPEMAVSFLTIAAGATCVPLSPTLNARELAVYLTDLNATALLIQTGAEGPAHTVAQERGLRIIELSPLLDAEAGIFTLRGESGICSVPHEFAQPDDVALMLPTAGTTSQPKIVPLTHANICIAAHNMRLVLGLTESDRCLNVLPFFHVHALLTALLVSLAAGASCVCNAGFSPSVFFPWLEEFCPTWYTAVPSVHQAIVAQAVFYREIIARCPLRLIRSGSAPLSIPVLIELEKVFHVPVIGVYGMTETAGNVTYNPLPWRARKIGSVGVAAGPEVAIMDEEGTLLARGAIGEIVVRGPTVFKGYYNNPMANSSAFTGGWFRSGDQGFLDHDGDLFITGRLKEIINRGGEKVAPQEIDDVLMEHPAVAQAVTFAVPHPRLGEDLAAAVVLQQNATTTPHAIRLFASRRLAAFKVPRHIYLMAELPKSPSGKLQRFGLAKKLGIEASSQAGSAASLDHTAPLTLMEEMLSGLWSQVLDIEHVGIHDDFFQLGGDSLFATQLITRIRDTLSVELSFSHFFEAPTVASMAQTVAFFRQAMVNSQTQPIPTVSRRDALPLSYAQQRLWFLEQLDPRRAVYNLPLAWHLSGVLNIPALEQSLGAMVRRHEILRTTFPAVQGQPMQTIAPESALSLRVVDFQKVSSSARMTAAQHFATENARCPFDLTRGPLVRFVLLRLSNEDHVLLITLHHIIFDGWSIGVFWRELVTLYTAICTGQPPSLPLLPIQYADFAVWQRQWLQGKVLEAQLDFWKQHLDDTLAVLELPTDRRRPLVQTSQGARQTCLFPLALTRALAALSRQESVTPFMILVAAFQTLLYRYTGQTNIVVGIPIAGRSRIETENLLGFFVNTLILRTELQGNPAFRGLLRRVREVMLRAYDHQDLPFEQLVETLQPMRDLSHQPLIQVMIALQPPPLPLTELPGLAVHPVSIDAGTAKFDLTLSIQDTVQGLLTTIEYNTDLFEPITISRMLRHYQILLEGIVTNPDQRIADIPLLTALERQQLLVEWNTTVNCPQDTCIHALFEVWARRLPDTIAVVCKAKQWTYGDLNQRANQMARHLQALGVGPEVCVGLCVEASLEMLVGLLGILKAGGAYVPLDPTYPAERLAAMIAEARIRVLVTQQQHSALLPVQGMQMVCLDGDWEQVGQQSTAHPVSGVTPENLAYVMYTSGSTGIPRGVMVEHRQVLAFLHGFERVAPGGEESRGTAVCPFGFDVAVWECFSMLCFGGTLHMVLPDIAMVPEQFVHYLVHHHITSAYIPPALLPDVVSHLEQQHAPLVLKRLLVGVEPIPQKTLQRFRALSAQLCIVNGYGPTESTVCATLFPFHAATEPDRRTPIGTRINGYEVYILDAHLQPVPLGVPGELCIGGAGLARGYINHPELTAERFIWHPFRTTPGARLYKTGDLARYLPDGNLEFLGRRDQQVKLHGYRIELSEIETTLQQHPAVREAVALVHEEAQGGIRRLVAYLVATQEPPPTSPSLRAFLLQKLPAYMVPTLFIMLERLPRTPQGKINRQALPLPDALQSLRTAPFAAPQTLAETTLAGIWADVLGCDRVGMHDNFFELGGDSIRGIQVVARANLAGLRLTPKMLFQHQTIVELAAVVGTSPAIPAEQGLVIGPVPLTPIQAWFFEQAWPDCHHWNQAVVLEVRHRLDDALLERAVQQVYEHHDMLRTRFRHAADGWQQHIASPETAEFCMRVDLAALSRGQQEAVMLEVATQLQTSLSLEYGPLLRVALFDCGPDTSARLLVIVHHLVMDNVSWWVLLQDLQTAYQQLGANKDGILPPKTTAFRHWAERLTGYAQSAPLRQELSYWLAALPKKVPCLPIDYPGGANTVASARTVSVALSPVDTTALLQEVHRAYQTHMDDVLLTALAQSFASWTGESGLLIDLEGHGREEVVEGVDLSRTLGWFTMLFPVLVQPGHATSPGAALMAVKEQLRRIPNRGIGYGVLRYLSDDPKVPEALQTLPQAQVCWNYLGRVDQLVSGPVFWGPIQEASGPSRSRQGRRPYLLEVNGRLVGNQLQCYWTYSEHLHRRDTIEALATRFIEALHTLIVHCQSPEAGGYTPSDFPNMALTQQELDELLTVLDESADCG